MSITIVDSQVTLAGAELRLRSAGPDGAPPVLFLHGWPQDASAWEQVMQRAAHSYRCHAIDLPGIGGSRLPRPNGDKAYLAGIVYELIERLGGPDVSLVGHDAGGMI